MRAARVLGLLAVLAPMELSGLGEAPAALSASPERLWVLVHASNRVHTLRSEELRAVFTSTRRFWPDRTPVVAINALPRSAERVRFDRVVLDMAPDDAGRYWIDQQVRGGPPPPRKAPSGRLAVAMVRRIEGAIAYVEAARCVPLGTKLVAVIDGEEVRAPRPEETPTCEAR